MTVKIDTDADINSVRLKESAAPATPSSGYGQIYAKSDGKVYFKNDAGLEIDLTLTGTSVGGWTLLHDEILLYTGTFTIPNIPNGYRELILFADLRSNVNAVSDTSICRFGQGSPDTASNYAYMVRFEGFAQSNQTSILDTGIKMIIIPGATASANYYGTLELHINEYSITGTWRSCLINGGHVESSSYRACYGTGLWKNSTSPIDTVYIGTSTTGSFVAGSRLRLYGM